MSLSEKTNITRIDGEEKKEIEDLIVRELPLTVMVNDNELVTLLCSPGELNYLACGFLLSEGIIRGRDDVKSINAGKNNNYINIELQKGVEVNRDIPGKRIISSGCGGGGGFYSLQDIENCKPLDSDIRINKDDVLSLMRELDKKSVLFRDTGGVHSAALAASGGIEVFSEDIGRHNAVDKIFGKCLLNSISTEDRIILTSGRISSEILIKVVKRGVSVIVSRSAPTDMAVKLAKKLKVTLVGFARGKRMNVYTHPKRIT